MRLRPLTEAECYARIYGGHSGEGISVVRVPQRRTKRATAAGEHLRERFEERLEARVVEEHGPEAEAA
jgi:RNA binding exosome subunit